MAARRPRRRRHARAGRRARAARRHDGRARRSSPRSSSARRAACRPSRATAAIPPRSASRRTRWSSTASPAPYALAGGRHPLGRRRRHARRVRRRLGLHVPGRRDLGRGGSGCSRSARRRSPPAIEQAGSATTSRTSRHAVQTVTEEAGFSVVRSLVGHGVGRSMHEDPQIPNFGAPGRGPVLRTGMTLRDRADDQRRPARTSTSTRTNGRSRPRTARFRPISSTPSRSRTRGPRILTRRLEPSLLP